MTRQQLAAACDWSLYPPAMARQSQRLDAIEDYLFIGGDKLSAAQAAIRLGVTRRTIQRYRAFLRAIGAGR